MTTAIARGGLIRRLPYLLPLVVLIALAGYFWTNP